MRWSKAVMGASVMRSGMARSRYIGLGMLLILASCSARRDGKRESQRSRDWRLHGELGFEPRDRAPVVDPHKAAQALVVAAHDLEATLRSSQQGLRCWLARGLLDFGLGGVDLDAQWAHQVNKAIKRLEHCSGRASQSEVVHDGHGRHSKTGNAGLVDRLHHRPKPREPSTQPCFTPRSEGMEPATCPWSRTSRVEGLP